MSTISSSQSNLSEQSAAAPLSEAELINQLKQTGRFLQLSRAVSSQKQATQTQISQEQARKRAGDAPLCEPHFIFTGKPHQGVYSLYWRHCL